MVSGCEKLLMIATLLALSLSSAGQSSLLEDFNDDSLSGEWILHGPDYSLSRTDQLLEVSVNEIFTAREAKFTYSFDALDLSGSPLVNLKGRASKHAIWLNVTFSDMNGNESLAFRDSVLLIVPGQRPVLESDYVSCMFDLSGMLFTRPDSVPLDASRITAVNLYLYNQYLEGRSTLVQFDDLMIGSGTVIPVGGMTLDFSDSSQVDMFGAHYDNTYHLSIVDQALKINSPSSRRNPLEIRTGPMDLEKYPFTSLKIRSEEDVSVSLRFWDSKGAYSNAQYDKKWIRSHPGFQLVPFELTDFRKDFNPSAIMGAELGLNIETGLSGPVYLDHVQFGEHSVGVLSRPKTAVSKYVEHPPVIDGIQDGCWEMVNREDLQSRPDTVTGEPDITDLSAGFRSCWDQESLYLLLDVTDDLWLRGTDSSFHDLIMLFIDPMDQDTESGRADNIDARFIRKLIIYPQENIVEHPGGTIVAATSTETGYLCEVKIPLDSLGLGTLAGNGVSPGFEVLIQDADSSETHLIGWSYTGGDPAFDPSTSSYLYGDLVFGHEPVQVDTVIGDRDDNGRILLLVDQSIHEAVSEELLQLKKDLLAEGWQVTHYEVHGESGVSAIKELIVEVSNRFSNLKAVLIIGHLAVPYSGLVKPDGHGEHRGAWPADIYYGDLDGIWTDETVNHLSAERPENRNIPGDGKFDQSVIPSELELMVGRVDLSDMPMFGMEEQELTRRYLQKDHAYRTGQFGYPNRVYFYDYWGTSHDEFSLFSYDDVYLAESGEYLPVLSRNAFIASYGLSWAQYTYAHGVGRTFDFTREEVHSVFNILAGSYFGDWDNTDNFLRAPQGSLPSILVSMYGLGINYDLREMLLGQSIGEIFVRHQNEYYYTNTPNVMYGIMGDPTLRFNSLKQVADVTSTMKGDSVLLTWRPPGELVTGYCIYHAPDLEEEFLRLNTHLVTDTSWYDHPGHGSGYYLVRPVRHEFSHPGNYYNVGTGSFDREIENLPVYQLTPTGTREQVELTIYPNPSNGLVTVQVDHEITSGLNLEVTTTTGQTVLQTSTRQSRTILDLQHLPPGIYLIRGSSSWGSFSKRLVLER